MKIKLIENFKQMEKRERRAYLGELLINNSLYIFLLAAVIPVCILLCAWRLHGLSKKNKESAGS